MSPIADWAAGPAAGARDHRAEWPVPKTRSAAMMIR